MASLLETPPARPVTPLRRLWRWAKRNRALAAAKLSTVALLTLLTVAASAGYLQATRAMQGELRQHKKAEANSEIAVAACRQLLARAYRELSYAPSFPSKTPPELGRTPASELLRGPEARERAAEILEKLVQDFPDAPDYRYDLSELYADAGSR